MTTSSTTKERLFYERVPLCQTPEVDAQRRHEAYLGSLPEMYRGYLDVLPPDIQRTNRELIAHAHTLSPHSFLYLHGVGGVGKTHLAVRAGMRLVQEGASALYVNESHFYRAIDAERDGGPKAPDLTKPHVLVYDDVGFKTATPAALQRFYEPMVQPHGDLHDGQPPAAGRRRLAGAGAGPGQRDPKPPARRKGFRGRSHHRRP